MKRLPKNFTFLLLLCLLFPGIVAASSTSEIMVLVSLSIEGGSISGRVTKDSTGFQDVAVTLSPDAEVPESPEYSALTDQDGFYKISGIVHEWKKACLRASKADYTFDPDIYRVNTKGLPATIALSKTDTPMLR